MLDLVLTTILTMICMHVLRKNNRKSVTEWLCLMYIDETKQQNEQCTTRKLKIKRANNTG